MTTATTKAAALKRLIKKIITFLTLAIVVAIFLSVFAIIFVTLKQELSEKDANLLLSYAVAVATVLYALLTWGIVLETRKMRQAQGAATISVSIQPREEWVNLIDIVVENTGSGPAYDITFHVTPDLEYRQGRFLSDLGFMRHGLTYLGPNRKIQSFLLSTIGIWDNIRIQNYEITGEFSDLYGQKKSHRSVISFAQLENITQLGEAPIQTITKSIKDIGDKVHSISEHMWRAYIKQVIMEERAKEAANKASVLVAEPKKVSKKMRLRQDIRRTFRRWRW